MATSKKKVTNKKKATKKASAKKPATDKPNRVFAIRVTDGELQAIHDAAGPRNATRFVRAIAAAFAAGDTKAFQAVLTEAKQARAAR